MRNDHMQYFCPLRTSKENVTDADFVNVGMELVFYIWNILRDHMIEYETSYNE